MGSLSSGEVTFKQNWFDRAVQGQDDLIRGINLWFWKTKTVKPYHRPGALRCINASTHAAVHVGCVLFLCDTCRSMK